MPVAQTLQHDLYDAVVIGGGCYGCEMAAALASRFQRVLVLEKEHGLLQRASVNNQARVHNGYHYPRSILTGYRSQLNFAKFVAEYQDCVVDSYTTIYAIGKPCSKVTAKQFAGFCSRIGAELRQARGAIRNLFASDHVEEIFQVREYVFHTELFRQHAIRNLAVRGVEVALSCEATAIAQAAGKTDGEVIVSYRNRTDDTDAPAIQAVGARYVILCVYSGLNTLLRASGLPVIDLKHEVTEIALLDVPDVLKTIGITVMCGPFFSCIPHPAHGLHSLSHVRYTPHCHWREGVGDAGDGRAVQAMETQVKEHSRPTRHRVMIQDAGRYVPVLKESRYVDSLWEIKTTLPRSETDDGRPILFKAHHGLRNVVCVLGGKIDNVFDACEELNEFLSRDNRAVCVGGPARV